MPMCELYQTALGQYDANQYAFAVVLSYTNIELLLEHFLIHMFLPKINDRELLKFLLEKNSNIKFRRDQLFKFLVGESYFQKVKDYITGDPRARDLEKFDEISKFRNELLHRGKWGDDLGIEYSWVLYDFLPYLDEFLDSILLDKNMDYYISDLSFINDDDKFESYP